MDVDTLPEGATSLSRSIVLNALPVEVLTDIVAFLDGRDIARLWICGCSILNRNLGVRGAVRKFELILDPLFAPKWPSIIDKLPFISEFCVYEYKHTKGTFTLGNLEFQAPLTLRTLSLSFSYSCAAFQQALVRTPSVFSALETLRLSGEQELLTSEQAAALKSLSSLTKLEFDIASYFGSFTDLVPPNVTHLKVALHYCQIMDFKLPVTLLTFKCRLLECSGSPDVGDLPRGLTTFCFDNDDVTFETKDILRLPPKLTHLNLRVEVSSEELWRALPPLLRTFKVLRQDLASSDYFLKLYPRSLTNISWYPLVTAENIENLPPGLTKLSRVAQGLQIIPKLPPNLRNFTGSSYLDGGVSAVASSERFLLPSRLTSLTYLRACDLAHCVLPATLKLLSVFGPTFTSEHTRSLPIGLQRLTVQRFDSDCLLGLPRGLTLLVAGSHARGTPSVPFTTEMASNLPSTLTLLRLYTVDVQSPETLYALPQGLEELDLKITALDKSCNLLKLPSSVRSLELEILTLQDGLGHALLSTLPRKLVSFNLTLGTVERSGTLTDIGIESIQHLPPALTELTIPGSAEIQSIKPRPSYLPQYLYLIQCGNRRLKLVI